MAARLWTPQGDVTVGAGENPAYVEISRWLRGFQKFLDAQQIGMHCAGCAKDIVGEDVLTHGFECVPCSHPSAQTRDRPLERVELRTSLTEWFVQFAPLAYKFGLGLHCKRLSCEADVVGANSDNEPLIVMQCGCREWIGPNREYRPEVTH